MRDIGVTGVQTCALPIWAASAASAFAPPEPRLRREDGSLGPIGHTFDGPAHRRVRSPDARQSVVQGQSVDPGGRRILKKNVALLHHVRPLQRWSYLLSIS